VNTQAPIPLQLLFGGVAPRESMPELVQNLMLAHPRPTLCGWLDILCIMGVGGMFIVAALQRFRRSVTHTQVRNH